MRRCPDTGLNCFDPACASGCAGYDVHIEAVTVVHTTIKRRAIMSLAVSPGSPPARKTKPRRYLGGCVAGGGDVDDTDRDG